MEFVDRPEVARNLAGLFRMRERSQHGNKKSPARAGLFLFKGSEDQLAGGVNFATRPSSGLKVCLARSP
jgi:hypothetical protein